MSRGLSAADAEDVVSRAWERARSRFDPARGSFSALLGVAVDNECRYWWRTWQRRASRELLLVRDPTAAVEETAIAERNQERLLAHLTAKERRLFATWALQKHLPNGRFPAAKAAASLGLDVRAYNNAKRRLKSRLESLLVELDLTAADLMPATSGGRIHAERN